MNKFGGTLAIGNFVVAVLCAYHGLSWAALVGGFVAGFLVVYSVAAE